MSSQSTRPVPKLTDIDLAFSTVDASTDWFPAWEDCKHLWLSRDPYEEFVASWFYNGTDTGSLREREGVDRADALRAMYAALSSWATKHEHKMAGCAMLLREWFELIDEKDPRDE